MSERVSDERLAAMIESHVNYVKGAGQGSPFAEVLSVLRELRHLRAQHREIICRQCGLREKIGQPAPVYF